MAARTLRAVGIAAGTSNNIGTNFNSGGGGVYVVQWTANNIKTWFFPRASVPASLLPGATPNICEFGTPDAVFNGCPFNTYFQDQTITFTNTFCGDWGGLLLDSEAELTSNSWRDGSVSDRFMPQ